MYHILAHQIGVSAVSTYLIKLCQTYPIPTGGKDKNRTDACQKTNDVNLMLRWRHHVMSCLYIFRNFREHF